MAGKIIKIFLWAFAVIALIPQGFLLAETTVTQVNVYSTPAPGDLVSSAVSTSSVILNWGEVAGASAYRIYRNDVLLTQISTTTYQDSSLSPSTVYSYRVSSLDGAGVESALSEAIFVTTLALPPVEPTSTPAQSGFVPSPGQKVVGENKFPVSSFKITYSGGSTGISGQKVILKFEAPGATHLEISNDPSFRDAQWEKFQPEVEWRLSGGVGEKIVYVRFQSQKEPIKSIFVESSFSPDKDELLSQLAKKIPSLLAGPKSQPVLPKEFFDGSSSSKPTGEAGIPVTAPSEDKELQEGFNTEKAQGQEKAEQAATATLPKVSDRPSGENFLVNPKNICIGIVVLIVLTIIIILIF